MLFVSANPGCGKSVLARHLIESELYAPEQSRTICYYFFKDDFEDQRSAKVALQSILHQLFFQRPELITDKVIQLFELARRAAMTSLAQLWNILIQALQNETAGEVVCVLDAYDECDSLRGEKDTFSRLLQDFHTSSTGMRATVCLKFLITSRFSMKTKQDLSLCAKEVPIIYLQGDSDDEVMAGISAEVDMYIEHLVSECHKVLHLTPDTARLLLETMRGVENRTYLWVYLTFEYLKTPGALSKEDIHKATSVLPQSVNDAYEKILRRSNDQVKARKLLHIIIAAERPLTLAEMQVALSIRETDTKYADLDGRLISQQAFCDVIKGICGLFITVFETKIYLIHQTAKEFLTSPKKDITQKKKSQTTTDPAWDWRASFNANDSHQILGRICIRFLLFSDTGMLAATWLKTTNSEVREHANKYPFLEYSSWHWMHHMRQSDTYDSAVEESLMKVCDMETLPCQTWFRVYWSSIGTQFPHEFTSIILASYFGFASIVKLLMKTPGNNPKRTDATYKRHALSWAAENGWYDVVKLFSPSIKRLFSSVMLRKQKQKDIDSSDRLGRTPLSYAAWRGHTAIVKRLVKAGACIRSPDHSGWSPEEYALCAGNAEVLEALRMKSSATSVDAARPDLLSSACAIGNEAVVRWLLEEKTYTEARDRAGYTPLWEAVIYQKVALVEILLEHGANTEAKVKKDGRTVLCYMVGLKRPSDAVRMIISKLLEYGADVNARDANGQTPAMTAATECSNPEILETLLKHGGDTNAEDVHGQTALSLCLAQCGNKKIVELLLRYGADANMKDVKGRPMLLSAAKKRRFSMMESLLSHGAEVNDRYQTGHKALRVAAEHKQDQLVKQLIECGVDVILMDTDSCTELLDAMNSETKDYFLGFGVDIDAQYGKERVALLVALERKDPILVEQVRLHHGDDETLRNQDHGILLVAAVNSGHVDMVQQLLSFDVDVHARDTKGRSTLVLAAFRGEKRILQVLLAKKQKSETPCDTAYTALLWAAAAGDQFSKRLLIDNNSGLTSPLGHRGLHSAVCAKKYKTLDLLLAGGTDPNLSNASGRTALQIAEEISNLPACEILIRGGARFDVVQQGQAMLWQAAVTNVPGLVALLLEKGVDPVSMVAQDINTRGPVMLTRIVETAGWVPAVAAIARQTLFAAFADGNESLMQTLLAPTYGFNGCREQADLYATMCNEDGETALWVAVKHGYEQIALVLLRYGASTAAPVQLVKGVAGRTVLHLAAATGRISVVRFLLSERVETVVVNAIDANGHTPLWLAIEGKQFEVTKLLLKAGARVDITDLKGEGLMRMITEKLDFKFQSVILNQIWESENRL